LVWPCSAPPCSGPPCSGPPCCTTPSLIQPGPRSSVRASQSSKRKSMSRWPKQDGIPWCGRARRRRARDRRARDRRAATANEITPDTAFVHAPLPTEYLEP
jgi:hypothetical protein